MSRPFRAGFGAELRAARERRKLTAGDVAAKLKFTVRQVEALEAEDFSHLPDDVFTRGFVRNYARLMGLEPETLIAPVDLEQTATEAITAPSAGVSLTRRGLRRWVLVPLLALAAFLLLVALLYYWLRQGENTLVPPQVPGVGEQNVAPSAESLPQDQPPAVAPQVSAAAPSPVVGQAAASLAPAAEVAAVAGRGVATAVPPAAATDTPIRAAPPPRDSVAERVTAPAQVTTGRHMLRFEPELDAWVQVVDNRGNSFSKLIRAGTSETFSGEPPFRLVVGEAARVKLTYNGHSIDLRPFIGQKVARLTLE